MKLTQSERGALCGRAPFSSSNEGAKHFLWAGQNDKGRRTLDGLVFKGLAVPAGRIDGFLVYALTESGEHARKLARGA
jgi:hypothetical protein